MNKEAYVSFEVAKLLKEKGFDWDTDKVYERSLMACRYEDYPMPTQQMACRWLREEKGLNVEVLTCPTCYVWRIMERRLKNDNGLYSIREVDCGLQDTFEKYENAVEAALEYCLTKLF